MRTPMDGYICLKVSLQDVIIFGEIPSIDCLKVFANNVPGLAKEIYLNICPHRYTPY